MNDNLLGNDGITSLNPQKGYNYSTYILKNNIKNNMLMYYKILLIYLFKYIYYNIIVYFI